MKSALDATIGQWSDCSLVRVLESSVQEARMQDHHTRDEVGPRPVARATSPSANLALLLISLLSSLLVIEIGYRFVAGLPVVKWTNWRVDAVSANRLGERAVFDPVIGWSVKP